MHGGVGGRFSDCYSGMTLVEEKEQKGKVGRPQVAAQHGEGLNLADGEP